MEGSAKCVLALKIVKNTKIRYKKYKPEKTVKRKSAKFLYVEQKLERYQKL